jgi:hypothetical protein
VAWWVPFINQLAGVAVVFGLDAESDDGFNACVNIFIDISKLN